MVAASQSMIAWYVLVVHNTKKRDTSVVSSDARLAVVPRKVQQICRFVVSREEYKYSVYSNVYMDLPDFWAYSK